MPTDISFREIENALRRIRQAAKKGHSDLFDNNVAYLQLMLDAFFRQERMTLQHNQIED